MGGVGRRRLDGHCWPLNHILLYLHILLRQSLAL